MSKGNEFVCDQTGPCFGRSNGKCVILTARSKNKEGRCKFQKPVGRITNGVEYPGMIKDGKKG